jgi:hypothetical protein
VKIVKLSEPSLHGFEDPALVLELNFIPADVREGSVLVLNSALHDARTRRTLNPNFICGVRTLQAQRDWTHRLRWVLVHIVRVFCRTFIEARMLLKLGFGLRVEI